MRLIHRDEVLAIVAAARGAVIEDGEDDHGLITAAVAHDGPDEDTRDGWVARLELGYHAATDHAAELIGYHGEDSVAAADRVAAIAAIVAYLLERPGTPLPPRRGVVLAALEWSFGDDVGEPWVGDTLVDRALAREWMSLAPAA